MAGATNGAGPRVSTLGEAMLRLSVDAGDRLEDASRYEVHVAGAEANVAFGLARVGVPAAWTSVLPANPLGRRVASTLSAAGVDVSSVRWVDGARLGTYFVEFSPAPRPTQVVYDRRSSAVAGATVEDFDWDRVLDATAFHTSGITMALSPGARDVTTHAVTEAARRGLFVSMDVNYRRQLWTPEEAAAAIRELAPSIDLLMCRAADAEELFGMTGETTDLAVGLREILGIASVVVTNGASGAAAAAEGTTMQQAAIEVEVIDRIGAGDAFAAGLLWGVLTERSVHEGLARGVAMASLKMTLRGDQFRLGADEVRALQAGHTMEINR
jgi:2-dehydro-3-deoxygluconokinase